MLSHCNFEASTSSHVSDPSSWCVWPPRWTSARGGRSGEFEAHTKYQVTFTKSVNTGVLLLPSFNPLPRLSMLTSYYCPSKKSHLQTGVIPRKLTPNQFRST